MTSWEKHYVVGEVVEGGKGRRSIAAKSKTKRRRPWKRWLFFAFLTFCVGMGLGLKEDQEFEAFVDQAVVSMQAKVTGESPTQRIWKRGLYNGYRLIYTNHFVCRMECRGIEQQEIWESFKNGVVINERIVDAPDQGHYRGDIVYTILGHTPENRPIKSVIAVNLGKRRTAFLTVMDASIDKSMDPCGEETCSPTR